MDAKLSNPNLKIILALGGWTESTGDKYSRMVNDANSRKEFVEAAVEFLTARDFDGLSIEWQYPVCWLSDCSAGEKKDKKAFTALLKVKYA